MAFVLPPAAVHDQQRTQVLRLRLHNEAEQRLPAGFNRLTQQIQRRLRRVTPIAQLVQHALLNAFPFKLQRPIAGDHLEEIGAEEVFLPQPLRFAPRAFVHRLLRLEVQRLPPARQRHHVCHRLFKKVFFLLAHVPPLLNGSLYGRGWGRL